MEKCRVNTIEKIFVNMVFGSPALLLFDLSFIALNLL